jgi:hypothetical protein
MEWYNIGYCKPIAHEIGVHMTLDHAEKTQQDGVAYAGTLEPSRTPPKAVMEETPSTVAMYLKMAEGASTPALKTLGNDFAEHEQAM